ncbi:hypothetical protein Tco_1292521, partial [Tanacetum coccineum]
PSDPIGSVADEAVHKELGDSLVRAATTASSLEAEQDSSNITKTRSKATPNESSSLGTTLGGGPRGNTLRSDKDRLKLNELMELCTTLQKKVLDLEKTKTTQDNEIARLKRRVRKLKKKRSLRTHKLRRLYKVGLSARVESSGDEDLGEDASKQGRRINAIGADVDITLVNVQDDADMFDVNTLTGDEVLAEQKVVTKDVNLTVNEVTLAQALATLNNSLKALSNNEVTIIHKHVHPFESFVKQFFDRIKVFRFQVFVLPTFHVLKVGNHGLLLLSFGWWFVPLLFCSFSCKVLSSLSRSS